MDKVKRNSTISQCLSFIPFEQLPVYDIHCHDRGKTLRTIPLLKIFVTAKLKNWRAYSEIETGVNADDALLQELNVSSVSGSQLSRRISQIPTELVHELLLHTIAKLQPICTRDNSSGIFKKLKVLDSSKFALPSICRDWARVTRHRQGVKLHVSLAVESPDVTYPENVVPSLGTVDDRRGAKVLVVDKESTYVMDRGYVDYKQMDDWDENGFQFVIRMWKNNLETVLEEYPVESGSKITRDARVRFGSTFRSMKREIRLVEFVDDNGKLYRIATNRWDLSAEDIAEIYKNRWLIELFFKWIKQHLSATRIHCTKPEGIWNELLLAMISYLLTLYIRVTTGTQKTQWNILILIRAYAHSTWDTFEQALNRPPKRSSKGRQKVSCPPAEKVKLSSTVAMLEN